MTAVDGGAADGSVGNDTTVAINVVASGTTEAEYDEDSNTLTVTLVVGDDEAAIQAAIDLEGTFEVSNETAGTTDVTLADTETFTSALTGGDDTVSNGRCLHIDRCERRPS